MPTAEAVVPTDRASRYLLQLCRHVDQMAGMRHHPPSLASRTHRPPEVRQVESSDTRGTVVFADGRWLLEADEHALTLRVEADDEASLVRLQDGIAARLKTIGRRDGLEVTWRRGADSEHPPGGNPPHGDPRGGPPNAGGAGGPSGGSGTRSWRARPGTVLLLAAGAMVIAIHLAVAAASFGVVAGTGWATTAVVGAGLVAVAVIGGHLVLGRLVLHHGKAAHAHWKLRRSAVPFSHPGRAGDIADAASGRD